MRLNGLSQVYTSSLGELFVEAQLDERDMSYLFVVDQIEDVSNFVALDMPTIHSSAIDISSLISPSIGKIYVLPIISSSRSVSTIITVALGKTIPSCPSITTIISTVPVATTPIISSTIVTIWQTPRQAPAQGSSGSGSGSIMS